jgi:hypothetical protein
MEDHPMKSISLRSFACGGALSLAFAIVPAAGAQCGLPTKAFKPMSWQSRGLTPSLMLASDDKQEKSIVGMWHVKFTAQTMNGNPISAVIDNAVAVWHKDGTEIMNSSRPAQDGNFCLGVWDHTGDHTYHLNHIPWQGNDPTNAPGIGNPQGGAQIIEDVVLDKNGDSYSGIFTLTAYDPVGNVEVTFTGVISAKRITPYTPFSDLLN